MMSHHRLVNNYQRNNPVTEPIIYMDGEKTSLIVTSPLLFNMFEQCFTGQEVLRCNSVYISNITNCLVPLHTNVFKFIQQIFFYLIWIILFFFLFFLKLFRQNPIWVKRWSWLLKTWRIPPRRNTWTMARTLAPPTMISSSCTLWQGESAASPSLDEEGFLPSRFGDTQNLSLLFGI